MFCGSVLFSSSDGETFALQLFELGRGEGGLA